MTIKVIEYGIHSLLNGLAGGRVYAVVAPQNAVRPFIIFQRISSSRWRSIAQPLGMAQVIMQIDCYADDFYASRALADSVEDILDGYSGTVYYGSDSPQASVRVAGISLDTEGDILDQTTEPFLFRNTANYLVTFEQ